MQISNAIVMITGAARGIGLSLAEQFLAKGATVIMFSRSGAPQSLLQQYPNTAIDFKGSVADIDDVKACIAIIEKKFKKLDILITNAGIAYFESLANTSDAHALEMIQTNLLGTFYCIREAYPLMKNNEGVKCVVGIHSIAATTIFEDSSVYSATKAGTLSLLRSFRLEARKNGISVIDVLPGATATAIWDPQMLEQHKKGMMTSDRVATVIIDALELSRTADTDVLSIDEITIRPWTGDL